MLSVVVPAVWGFDPFCNFLDKLVRLPVIGEVLIINNNVSKTPDHSVLSNSKVVLLNQKENIFVNPAWNLGVAAASYDKVCIMNDDVLVDLRVFFEANDFVNNQVGLLSIGNNFDIYRYHSVKDKNINIDNLIISGDIEIVETKKTPNTAGSGSLFFLAKNNWIEIPEEFKIYWGDTWQFDWQYLLGRINYTINNCFFYSPWSVASKIAVGSEYQQTEEFKKFENVEYFKYTKVRKLKQLNLPIPDTLLE